MAMVTRYGIEWCMFDYGNVPFSPQHSFQQFVYLLHQKTLCWFWPNLTYKHTVPGISLILTLTITFKQCKRITQSFTVKHELE